MRTLDAGLAGPHPGIRANMPTGDRPARVRPGPASRPHLAGRPNLAIEPDDSNGCPGAGELNAVSPHPTFSRRASHCSLVKEHNYVGGLSARRYRPGIVLRPCRLSNRKARRQPAPACFFFGSPAGGKQLFRPPRRKTKPVFIAPSRPRNAWRFDTRQPSPGHHQQAAGLKTNRLRTGPQPITS